MSWRFRPRAWMVLLTALGCALMISAGLWQLRRADEKRVLIASFERLSQAEPQAFDFGAPVPGALRPAKVELHGRYLASRQLWLDNQVSEGQVGYRVWTPLELDDRRIVLVDRGWVAAPPRRDELPQAVPPSGPVRIEGYWRELPQAGLHVRNPICGPGATRVVQYPRYEELQCLFEAPLAQGLLLLSPTAEGGYRRDWQWVDIGPQRHLGYALQWFAFSATLFALFVILNVKRSQ